MARVRPRGKQTARWRCIGYRNERTETDGCAEYRESWVYECALCKRETVASLKERPPETCPKCGTTMRWFGMAGERKE